MRKGFSFIELIIVVVVVGILSAFAVPQFAVTQERARDREARSVLGIIWSAERAYRMEQKKFYPSLGSLSTSANAAVINKNLRLNLSAAANSSWNYTLNSSGSITAARTGGSRPRTLKIDAATDDIISCAGAGCF